MIYYAVITLPDNYRIHTIYSHPTYVHIHIHIHPITLFIFTPYIYIHICTYIHRYRAYKEAAIMMKAKKRIKSTQHIIDAYGLIEGPLPDHITQLLHLPAGEVGVCLVLRYEAGGSLHQYIAEHSKARMHIPMREKIRVIYEISKGIHQLHSHGIVHADLKVSWMCL